MRILVACSILLIGCTADSEFPITADVRERVEPGIFQPDAPSDYPRLAKKLGPAWSRLQSGRERAALQVAADPQTCDYVEVSEASDRSTQYELVFFVDCRNRHRAYIRESALR